VAAAPVKKYRTATARTTSAVAPAHGAALVKKPPPEGLALPGCGAGASVPAAPAAGTLFLVGFLFLDLPTRPSAPGPRLARFYPVGRVQALDTIAAARLVCTGVCWAGHATA
jgi:hypothetical protein